VLPWARRRQPAPCAADIPRSPPLWTRSSCGSRALREEGRLPALRGAGAAGARCPVRAPRRWQRPRGRGLVLQRLPRHEPASRGRRGRLARALRARGRLGWHAQHRGLPRARARAGGRARRSARPGGPRSSSRRASSPTRPACARSAEPARRLRDPLGRAQPRIDDRRASAPSRAPSAPSSATTTSIISASCSRRCRRSGRASSPSSPSTPWTANTSRRYARSAPLAAEHGALTYLDETHAAGAYGHPGRRRRAGRSARQPRVTIVQGSLAKGYGALGGFIAGPAAVVDRRAQPRQRLHLHDPRCRRRSPLRPSPACATCAPRPSSARRSAATCARCGTHSRRRASRRCRARATSCRCSSLEPSAAARVAQRLPERAFDLRAADQLSVRPARRRAAAHRPPRPRTARPTPAALAGALAALLP